MPVADRIELVLELATTVPVAPEKADRMVGSIMSELRGTPAVEVKRLPGPPPPANTKSSLVSLCSELLVAFSGGMAVEAIKPALHGIGDWLGRQTAESAGTSIVVSHMGSQFKITGNRAVDSDTINAFVQRLFAGS